MTANERLDRREVVARLLQDRKDLLVVTGLGSSSYDVMAVGDHDGNCYLWAAIGALATISVSNPANLTIAVIDNGKFGETGQQTSHAGYGIEIAKVAESVGFVWTDVIADLTGVDDLRGRLNHRDGPQLATVKVKAENAPRVLPPRDGTYVKTRFRAALGHAPI